MQIDEMKRLPNNTKFTMEVEYVETIRPVVHMRDPNLRGEHRETILRVRTPDEVNTNKRWHQSTVSEDFIRESGYNCGSTRSHQYTDARTATPGGQKTRQDWYTFHRVSGIIRPRHPFTIRNITV